ncbi:RidA family protein [Marinobacter salarius]|uniref:RidA family protein n=1 Tax=Marinobacter salarius TaxID=1420917 RepID=UPI0032EAFE00
MSHPQHQVYGLHKNFPICRAAKAGNFLFCSGQVPMSDDGELLQGDIQSETRFVLDALGQTLREAGMSYGNVVKANIFIANVSDFAAFNAVYSEYFPHSPPARSAIRSDLLVDARIEIELTAYSEAGGESDI